jgi:TetR/AcrR family transcriptional repressor of nem operon
MRQYLSRSHRDRAAEGCPLPAVVSELATAGSPRLRVALADELRARADSIYDLHPSIRGVSAGQAALATVALFYGGLALSRATAGTPVSDDILRACRAYARTALRAFEQMSA